MKRIIIVILATLIPILLVCWITEPMNLQGSEITSLRLSVAICGGLGFVISMILTS